jgi:thioesterase domain-containing protein
MSAYPQEYRRFARIHWNAFAVYRPRPFHGKAVLFRGDEQYLLRLDGVDGWRKLVLGGLEVRSIVGKHEAILAEPCVHTLAGQLSECLDGIASRQSL